MKNLKKVLALVIALTMVLTTVAFASYPDVDADANYASAVELLSALKILQGDENGNFNPDNTITRAEYAAVVCRALGMENAANSAKGATIFTDVAADHWATGYINLATQQGIVNGKGNGIFDPEGNVTYAEAVKMLVVALGYEPMASQRGGYPTGYLTVANSTKMTANVSSSGTDTAALRSTVAQLTANALEVPNMEQTGFGTDTKYEVLDKYDNYKTLLTQMDIYKATGVVESVDASDDTASVKLSEESDDYEFGYKNNKGDTYDDIKTVKALTFNINGSDIESYLQQNVDVYVYKAGKSDYDIVYVTSSGIGSSLKIDADDLDEDAAVIGGANSTIGYYEDSDATKTTKIDVVGGAPVYVNGYKLTGLTYPIDIVKLVGINDATVEFVENSDDKYYDMVLVTVYEHGIVDDVEADRERINFVGGNSVKFDSSDKNQVVKITDKDGNAMNLKDIKSDDVLAMLVELDTNEANGGTAGTKEVKIPEAKNFANAANKLTIIDLGANTVTGSLDQSNDEKEEIFIDSTKYDIGVDVDGNQNKFFKAGKAKLGTEGTFYLDINGKVIGFDGTTGGTTSYGYILQTAYNTSSGFEDGWEVKMLTADKGIVTYKLNSSITINDGESQKTDTFTKATKPFADFTDKTAFKADPATRVVEYKVTSNDELKSLDFFKHGTGSGAVDDTAKVDANSEYRESTGKVNGKTLATDAVIFYLDNSDMDDATVGALSSLVDQGEYTGIVADKDNSEYAVFVVTEGQAAYGKEDGICVVDSVNKSTYNSKDSYNVTYYSNGETAKKTAIFIDGDSKNKGAIEYTALKKGDVFVANVNDEGLVSDYSVLAQVTKAGFKVSKDGFNGAYKSEFNNKAGLEDGVDYVVGYIKDITTRSSKKSIEVALDKDASEVKSYTIEKNTNAYSYNEAKNTVITAGDWYTTDVAKADNGEYTFVFFKLYDGDVVDVYTINNRFKDALDKGIFANSAAVKASDFDKTTTGKTTGEETSTSSVKEEVKEETPVVEVPVAEEDFE